MMDQPGILLIEDDYEDAYLMARVLRKYRIANRIEAVREGEEALRLLRNGFPVGAVSAIDPAHPEAGLISALPFRAGSKAAHDPAQTLKLVPELVLLDCSQPRMPAMEVVIRLRSLPALDQTPVIVCCGSPAEEQSVKQWGMRRVACMSKPAGFFKLLECIQKLEMHWQVFASKPPA
jgi:CheY-like chemotaxis protein